MARPRKGTTAAKPAPASKAPVKKVAVKKAPASIEVRTAAALDHVEGSNFPRDYEKLTGSLQNGRDNAVTRFHVSESVRDGDSLMIATHLSINGSELPTLVPLNHGREFVRRLTDLLDRAEAEGLNVG